MDIPKKIDPCPIVEAIVELRFDSSLPNDAVFGVIYNQFKDEFEKVGKLPILQLPENIRSKDKNLIYKPHYKLQKGEFVVQIGPKVFSFSNVNEYVGWDTLSEKIKDTVEKLANLKIIKKMVRFGLRYINLFADLNIYEKSRLKIQLGNENQFNREINLTMGIPTKGFATKLIMVNSAEISFHENKGNIKGSIIDIDVAMEKEMEFDLGQIEETVSSAHEQEKELFFSLLEPDFLKTLNPEY